MGLVAQPGCCCSPAPPRSAAQLVGCPPAPAAAPPPAAAGRPRRRRASSRLPAAVDPAALQDLIVGSAVTAAVSAALVGARQREPEVCAGCAGAGGVRCFACEGSGRMEGLAKRELAAAAAGREARDPLGRSAARPCECTACRGVGMLLCKRCGGSGYTKGM